MKAGRTLGISFASTLVAVASAARAQCPVGTAPIQLPVAVPQPPTGSDNLAVDQGIAVTDDPGTARMQVFRLGTNGWSLDRLVVGPQAPSGIAVRGDIMAVRSSGLPSGDPSRVQVFRCDPVTRDWTLAATLTAPWPGPSDFGGSPQLGPSTLLFNSIGPDQPITAMDGSVLVYALPADGVPSLVQTIDDPQPGVNRFFGYSMALDGDILAVSVLGDSDAGVRFGAVYVFRRVNAVWSLVQKIVPDSGGTSPRFGTSVALHNGHLAIAALRSISVRGDTFGNSFSNGFVRVYEWTGTAFQLSAHLTNPSSPSTSPTAFGQHIALRGSRLIVGSMLDTLGGANSGAAYIYSFGAGAWRRNGVVGLPDGSGGWFGYRVGLTDTHAFGLAPFYDDGHLAVAIFDECALPPAPSGQSRCMPGMVGLISYLVQFFQQDAAADYNLDGHITSADLAQFLQAWFAGCP